MKVIHDFEITVICISFNQEKYILDTLKGIFNQKLPFRIQVLIHDDASSDSTQDEIRNFLNENNGKFEVSTILRDENIYSKGVKPLPGLFSMARGKYIAFCEGDDIWNDDYKLINQYKFMNNHPSVSLCYHDSNVIDEYNNPIADRRFDNIRNRDYKSIELQLARGFISTQTIFFRREAVDKLPDNYHKVVNEDTFIFALCGLIGDGAFLPNINSASYRIHNNGVWSKASNKSKYKNMANSYFQISLFYFKLKMFKQSLVMLTKSTLSVFRMLK